jgi:hypothetical protein
MATYGKNFRTRLSEPGPMPMTWAIFGPRLFAFVPAFISLAMCGAVLVAYQFASAERQFREDSRMWGDRVAGIIQTIRGNASGKHDYSGISREDLSDFFSQFPPSENAGIMVIPVPDGDGKPNMAVKLSLSDVPEGGCVGILSSYIPGVRVVWIHSSVETSVLQEKGSGTALEGMPSVEARKLCSGNRKSLSITFN